MKALDVKSELKLLIDAESDLSLLESLKSLLSQASDDWWLTIGADERKDIEQGISEADRGEFIAHEEVMKNPKKWR